MSKKNIIKLILLNLGIVALNVVLFSQGLVGLTIGGDALLTAIGVTTIVMSLIGFGYGTYSLLFKQPQENVLLFKAGELAETKDYVAALEERRDKKIFEPEINSAVEQIYRMQDKDKALDSILAQFFSPQEMTYTRFQTIINSVQEIFYNNIKKMINRMIIFDYKDYMKVLQKLNNSPMVDGVKVSSKSVGAQLKIYNEHIYYVRELVEMNEGILVKMDSLLLEISKLDDLDTKGLENIAAVQEFNELIAQTKFYKA